MKIDRETSHGSFEDEGGKGKEKGGRRFGCLRSERRSRGVLEVAENTAS